MEFEITRRDVTIGSASLLVGGSGGYLIGSERSKNNTDSDTDDTNDDQGKNSLDNEITIENRPYVGNMDATIRMVYWMDYKCPFCNRFESAAMTELKENYINPGEISIVYKPLGVIKESSIYGALAAHCVWENGVTGEEFTEWGSDLMDAYLEENRAGTSTEIAIAISESYGVNGENLRQCIEDETYIGRVSTDYSEGTSWDFSGTPYFLIYNTETFESKTVVGNQPFEAFRQAIESLK